MGRYRISQLAGLVGVPTTTLRYYETRGLLPARRDPNGYRTYDDHDVERVRFITSATALGLPLTRIRDVVAVWQDGVCRDVRDRLLPLVADRLDDLDGRLRDLGRLRTRLVATRDALHALASRDTPCDPACALLTDDPTPAPRPPHDGTVPVACSLPAGDHAERVQRWRDVLAGATPQHRSDGVVRVSLGVDRLPDLTALVVEETRCCPFLTFALAVTPAGVRLDVGAPDDARPLLDELFPTAPTGSRPC